MDYDTLLLETEDRMEKAILVLSDKYRGMRTGRANPGLVESIRVDYYGSLTPLKQIATISAPEPDLLMIKPYDTHAVGDIEKAIQKSDLGIHPASDGKIIRLKIPPLSEERRNQLVSRAKEVAEETRVAIRNIRRDANEQFKKSEKQHSISEDEMHAKQDDVQKLTDKYIATIDEVVAAKEKEVMEI